MLSAPSVEIRANHTRDSSQMLVNLFPDTLKISRLRARVPRSTTARKLPQRPADDGKLLVRRRQQKQFPSSQLRLPCQLRADQRHDPPIAVQARRGRPLLHHHLLCGGQPDFDTTARLSYYRPSQSRFDLNRSIVILCVDCDSNQLPYALAGRHATARAPSIPAWPERAQLDAQALTESHG
ncbi:hypothetical protein R69658_05215 [Paraburkholderia aspalathi]|uniref:Uncharacterized protein n=1 Tax=Paraburkholderia aspalathi TaxID=1324617 RepID=A0ABM8SFQ1_9BURK|nr:hypothetical protein R69658_05215 [Paraburkholderia aspalathi]